MIEDFLSNPVETLLSNPTYLIIIVSVIVFMVIFQYLRFRKEKKDREGKVHVIIHRPIKDKEVWLRPEEDGVTFYVDREVAPDKARGIKGHPEWKFTTSKGSIHLDRKGKEVIDVIQDAGQAISWNYEEKTTEQPLWNRREAWKFITTKLLHIRYHTEEKKVELPNIMMLFIITIILIAVTLFLTIYSMYKQGLFSNPQYVLLGLINLVR